LTGLCIAVSFIRGRTKSERSPITTVVLSYSRLRLRACVIQELRTLVQCRTNDHVHAEVDRKGTRIAQADSGADSDSESRNKNEEIIPVNCLTQTVWNALPTKDILCTDWRQLPESESEPESACTTLCADQTQLSDRSRNLNLPALYAYRKDRTGSASVGRHNGVNDFTI
jgi:hypothetical protein